MNQEEAAAFEAAVKEAPPALLLQGLAAHVAEKTGLERSYADHALRMLASMYSLCTAEDKPLAEFLDAIVEASKVVAGEGTEKAEPVDWADFRERLERLLSLNRTLGVAAKAWSVMTQHEHVLCTTRILTDIRAVMSPDLAASPAAAVIVHQLKISYHDSGEIKDFYVALDSEDVKSMRRVLDRAVTKEDGLRKWIATTNVPILNPDTHS